jgi:hypothetical protein
MKWRCNIAVLVLIVVIAFTASGDYLSTTSGNYRTAREADTSGAPTWPIDGDFKKDTFTFARIQYTPDYVTYGRGSGPAEDRFLIDFPLSDLDLSYRLHQMTSLNVDPDGRVVKIADKELFDYPFLYVVEPGRGVFKDEELPIMRKYLLNGGFMVFDDFWGDREWEAFAKEMERLFPERQYPKQKVVDLPLEHAVFHSVFDLKEKPQVPGIPHFVKWGRTHERGAEGEEVHFRGIFDDKGRLMVMICHNTDLGDGWEREGENEEYFRQFSEPKAFPMGINIIVYAMTH